MEEKIIRALASALKLDADEFVLTLKEGDKFLPDDEVVGKVTAAITSQVKAARDDQYKRATRESWTTLSKALKKEGFEPGDLQGEDMVNSFVEHVKSNTTDTPPKPEDEDSFKKHPIVKKLISEAKADIGKKVAEIEQAHAKEKAGWQKERTSDVIKGLIPSILADAKVLLEVPGVKKETRLQTVIDYFAGLPLAIGADGNPELLDSDGNAATDDFGKKIDFKKKVADFAIGLFGVSTQDPNNGGGNPGNPGGTPPKEGEVVAYKFADAADFTKQSNAESDPAKRAKMFNDYAQQRDGANAAD